MPAHRVLGPRQSNENGPHLCKNCHSNLTGEEKAHKMTISIFKRKCVLSVAHSTYSTYVKIFKLIFFFLTAVEVSLSK